MRKESITFHAKISPSSLKEVVKILGGIMTDTVNLRNIPNGITITAMDRVSIAILSLKLNKVIFDKFDAADLNICIDMERLKKIVNLSTADDSITMRFDSKENQFDINLGDLKTSMGLVDDERSIAPPAILNSSGHIVLRVNNIRRSIIAAESFSDIVTLSMDSEKFELKAEKNMDLVHLNLSKDKLIEHHTEVYHKNSYLTNYLSSIISCLNGENYIRLCFGNGTQLQLDYDFLEGGGHLTYVLLPRLEE
jgi:proliferating cell nuclear antigen